MRALVDRWRADLGAPELPFIAVPITPYERRLDRPAATEPPRGAAPMRALLQELDTHVAHLWSIPTLDLGERYDIHPRRKREVGERLARAALANSYGRPVHWAGPRLNTVTPDGDGWVLHFRAVDGGLVVTADALTGFEIEVAAGVWEAARAEVLGPDRIRVWTGESDYRGGVRYGWWNWFVPTVVNGDGLPLGTFATR